VIFGISLAAVSADEMILVCLIVKLWWLFFVDFVSTREMNFLFISKRKFDDDHERIHNNHNCDDENVYRPQSE
jgi:uncharacterized membrane protein